MVRLALDSSKDLEMGAQLGVWMGSLMVRLALDRSKDLEMGVQLGMEMGTLRETVHELWKIAWAARQQLLDTLHFSIFQLLIFENCAPTLLFAETKGDQEISERLLVIRIVLFSVGSLDAKPILPRIIHFVFKMPSSFRIAHRYCDSWPCQKHALEIENPPWRCRYVSR